MQIWRIFGLSQWPVMAHETFDALSSVLNQEQQDRASSFAAAFFCRFLVQQAAHVPCTRNSSPTPHSGEYCSYKRASRPRFLSGGVHIQFIYV
jgi:hypothetical protein